MSTDRSVLNRRNLLAGLAASVALPAFARAPARSPFPHANPRLVAAPVDISALPIRRPAGGLSEFLARANLSGETGVVALDAETGEVIEEHRGNLLLPPASTAKAVTAMYAVQALGLEYRFVTRVLIGRGQIEDGTLRGDLVLKGGGDPVLQTADLAALADALIAQGLRRVEGRFLVDGTALPTITHIDRTQPVEAGYNPSLSGINLNFNRVHFGWDVQGGRASVMMDARSNREVPEVSVIDMQAVSRNLPVYTHDFSGARERWTVAGSALRRAGSRWLPVRRPQAYAGDVLRVLLQARGCRLPEAEVTRSAQGGAVIAEHRSPPLTTILRGMLRYSTNLTAECVGLAASTSGGQRLRALAPSARMMNQWAARAHGARGVDFLDHSGLGAGSRISTQAMAQFMLSARREGILPDLLREHPMRDAQGQQIRNHPVEVLAKTGTINFVSALTGYAQPRGGRPIVFSIISADLSRRRAPGETSLEQPAGTRAWTRRARVLQQDLIERWTQLQG